MIGRLIFWKITKLTYLIALFLAFVLLLVQIFRLSFVIFGLPLTESSKFFLTWFSYYTFFFLPDGLTIAIIITLFDMKEKKLIHIMHSFGMSPKKIFAFFVTPALAVLSIGVFLSFVIFEEHVSFARKTMFAKFKDKIFENTPTKTFLNAGDVVFYITDKRADKFTGVFLAYKDKFVLAKEASYKGNGVFLFRNGSIVSKDEDKYFLIYFGTYELRTEEYYSPELRTKRIKKDKILNVLNYFTIPLLIFPAFLVTFYRCSSSVQAYYLIAATFIARQAVLFGIKISL